MSSYLAKWDAAYEWKAVTLLSLGFGLVGLDRFMIVPMFPTIMKALHLNYQNLGQITGALSIAWGISALFTGRISDVLGRRRVVVTSIIIFSLLVGISGLAAGLGSLIMLRILMGLADGAYTPPSIVATIEASKPPRQGLNIGIQQMMLPLFGLALAPLIVTQLLQVIDWRWIFLCVTPFGLIISVLLFRVLRPPAALPKTEHTAVHDSAPHRWSDVLKYPNIIRNMVGMFCWLTCLTVTTALLPNYLIDYRHLPVTQMGFVMSAIGFGAAIGTVIMPWISDKIGRKPVMLISTACGCVALLLFMSAGTNPVFLFLTLFATHFFNFALISLTVGVISAESVPATLMASASGTVICVGEIFGGGIAPIIAGTIAQDAGIQYIIPLAAAALAIGFLNSCFLAETAPTRLRRLAGPAVMPGAVP